MDIEDPESLQPVPDVAVAGVEAGLGTLVKGSALHALAVGTGLVLGLPAAVLLVRSLGIRDYGAYAFAMGIVAFAGTVADLGVDSGVLRMSSFASGPAASAWGRAAGRVALAGGLVATGICWASALALHGAARTALSIGAPLALAAALRGTLSGYLMARRRIALVEGTFALQQVLFYGAAIALVAAGQATVARVVWAQVVARWIAVGFILPAWRAETFGTRRSATESAGKLIRFSLPLLAQSVSWTAMQRSDVILLGAIRGSPSVGLYAPVLRVVDTTAVATGVLGAYYVPVAAPLVARSRMDDLRSTYTTMAKWRVVLLGPVLGMLIVAPGPVLSALFGARFAGTGDIATILAVGYAINVLTGDNARTLVALGKTRQIGVRSVVALVANVGLNALLIPSFGIAGAAWGTSIAYTGLNVANSVLIFRAAGVHPIRSDFVTVVAAAAGAAVAGWVVLVAGGWTGALGGSLGVAASVGVAGLAAAAATTRPEERVLLRRISHPRRAVHRAG